MILLYVLPATWFPKLDRIQLPASLIQLFRSTSAFGIVFAVIGADVGFSLGIVHILERAPRRRITILARGLWLGSRRTQPSEHQYNRLRLYRDQCLFVPSDARSACLRVGVDVHVADEV